MKLKVAITALVAGLTFSAGGAGIAQAHDMGLHFPNNSDRHVFAFSGHTSVACGGVHRRASVMKLTSSDSIAIAEYRRGTTFIYDERAYELNQTRLSPCGNSISHVRACEKWSSGSATCTSWHT